MEVTEGKDAEGREGGGGRWLRAMGHMKMEELLSECQGQEVLTAWC